MDSQLNNLYNELSMFRYLDYRRRDLEHADKMNRKGCVLDMKLNCIWWFGYSSGDGEFVEYPFIDIIPLYTLAWNVNIY